MSPISRFRGNEKMGVFFKALARGTPDVLSDRDGRRREEGLHRPDGCTIVAAAEDGGARDENVRSGVGDGTDVLQRDASVHLQQNAGGHGADHLLRLSDPGKGAADELLPPEAGVHGHNEQQVDVGQNRFDRSKAAWPG